MVARRSTFCHANGLCATKLCEAETAKLVVAATSLPHLSSKTSPILSLPRSIPIHSGSGSGGQVAKDALGNDVIAAEWLKTHGPGDRTLTQGLKVQIHVTDEAQYLRLSYPHFNFHSENRIEKFGMYIIRRRRTSSYAPAMDPYNDQGRVVRGPAPLSLALAHADIDDGKVFVPWVETDFRTGEAPW
ncbi:hypothetical protein ACFX2J_004121 [Malus domestica]